MFNFKKALTRKKFWKYVVVSYLIYMVVDMIITIQFYAFVSENQMYYIPLKTAPLLAFWIIQEIRRLHDANFSGLITLFNIIPGIGTLGVLIFAGAASSNYVNNRWITLDE